MTVEPGWYYAAGDPVGTVRSWNGSEWTSEPHADPNAAAAEGSGYADSTPTAATATAVVESLADVQASGLMVHEQQTERGFYYAPGDPVGTVRLWDGTAWVGFPVRDPNMSASEISTIGVKAFAPVQGQTKLAGMAIATQLVLILLVATHLFLAYAMFDLASWIGDLSTAPTSEAFADTVDTGSVLRFGAAVLVQMSAWIIAGAVFITWFYMAYRNMSLWHKPRRDPMWTIFAWFVPFISAVRPMSMMMELLESSPREDRRGEANPILAIAWWLLWILPGALLPLLFVSGDPEDLGPNVLQAIGVASILNAISVALAIVLVQKVTDHQDSRFHPTAAQRERMKVEAEIQSFKESESSGLVYGV